MAIGARSRPSSPMNASPSIASGEMTPLAASTPTAIARSRPDPALRSPDGARLTVILCFGQGRPLLTTAARARSMQEFSFQVFEAFTAATVIYLALSAVVTIGMRYAEKRLVIPGFNGGKA